MKKFYSFIFLLIVSLLASVAVLGSVLGDNVGKNPNTISISLPSLYYENTESNLNDWEYVSEMTLFGSNYGENREKVISPGMSNSVEISIENRNDEALDYEVVFSFSSSDENLWIPLQCKITRYDGTLLTDEYVAVETLTNLTDKHTIGGNRYAYYIVDWYWPSSEDDTEIGNIVMDENLKIFSSISATTNKSETTDVKNGIAIEYDFDSWWKIGNIVVGVIIGLSALITCLKVRNIEDENLLMYH